MKTMNFRRALPRIVCSLGLFCTTILVAPLTASAALITVPSGLNPGDQFRLVFLTSTTRDAQSTNIADYNAFVNGVANALTSPIKGLSTWTAIASTESVAARDNTGTHAGVSSPDVPIYRLDGTKVANGNADFWDGSILALINTSEAGNNLGFTFVFTGTETNGTSHVPYSLGNTTRGMVASVNLPDSSWITAGVDFPTSQRALYGMSGTLTVVPEPGTIVLTAISVAGLVVSSLRQRRNRSAATQFFFGRGLGHFSRSR